ncbi:MAG: DUF533 domain-containing protein [Cereibacter sphaeroides]|uniref:DUF533 domain-containing protein n=1 Tax=Cereibacter sphaeroides TaxID=1063 RepID=A0A2W5SAW1_CERSP|nr:MAG: DUF533 domain-containing protein [Cereibacter sphaeroides]
MSFMKTLAKVAIGVAIAKGVGGMIQQSRQGGKTSAGGGGLFGGANSPGAQGGGAAPGGLQDMMRDVLGGTPSAGRARQANPGQTSAPSQRGGIPDDAGMGGLGGLLEQLTRASTGGATRAGTGGGGGLDDILGQLTKGGGKGGGLGDILGGLAGAIGGAAAGTAMAGGTQTQAPPKPGAQKADAGFGDLLNQSLQNYGEPDTAPAPQQEAAAALMLRAMIQAAKADGKVDDEERAKLLNNLQDATQQELDFVKAELAAPVDIEGLARQVPKGLEGQIYTMSVMAISLDNKVEAQYLHELAQALGIDPQQVNSMHAQLGVPALYA